MDRAKSFPVLFIYGYDFVLMSGHFAIVATFAIYKHMCVVCITYNGVEWANE